MTRTDPRGGSGCDRSGLALRSTGWSLRRCEEGKRYGLRRLVAALAVMSVAFAAGCGSNAGEDAYTPAVEATRFVDTVDNSCFPLRPGTTYIYEGVSEEGAERVETAVTSDTRKVMGVPTVVVWDRVWLEGELIEETYDWYAQDQDGNVWYFGEDSRSYEGGSLVSTEGSWEAGIDGALPGIVMEAQPVVGHIYRQEYCKGEAEDMAEVLSTNASADVPYGAFTGCVQTREWTPLASGQEEHKYYAHGVGTVLEVTVKGGTGTVKLVNIVAA